MKTASGTGAQHRDTAERRVHPALRLLKRLGIGGFLFFLIKGLLWLAVPYLITLFF